MSITLTGFGGTSPAAVLSLLSFLVSSGSYTSIIAERSQNIEYELLKAPYRTFFNTNAHSSNDKKVVVYNLPNSLAEYLVALNEVHAIRSACYSNETVITYDPTSKSFLVDPSTLNEDFRKSSACATLAAIAKLDALAAENVTKNGDTVLLIGSGGREHALAVALSNSPLVKNVICAPGNGGTVGGKISNAKCEDTKNATIVRLVRELNVDMVVVGPEQPLVDGLVDCLKVECAGVRVFGPSRDAAELEASKVCCVDLYWQEVIIRFHRIDPLTLYLSQAFYLLVFNFINTPCLFYVTLEFYALLAIECKH